VSTGMYALEPFDMLMGDGHDAALWLHDLPDDTHELQLQALVVSGDYFETLAATLEQIACALPVHAVEQYQLQDIIGQLLYMQCAYAITKKTRPTAGA
jgi:hypothetical protein